MFPQWMWELIIVGSSAASISVRPGPQRELLAVGKELNRAHHTYSNGTNGMKLLLLLLLLILLLLLLLLLSDFNLLLLMLAVPANS